MINNYDNCVATNFLSQRTVFHHAMKLVHVVEPDFPEAIIDIVTTDRMDVRNFIIGRA